MHRRKRYYIYPPGRRLNDGEMPGDRDIMRRSKIQAWKAAVKFGVGAEIVVVSYLHKGKRCGWWIRVPKGWCVLAPLKRKPPTNPARPAGFLTN